MSKFRSGWVSNSSSSSFIVIGSAPIIIPEVTGDKLHVPAEFEGETDFGWGPAKHKDLGSRINFSYLQAEDHAPYLDMLEEVLKESFDIQIISWKVHGYIDHASSAREGMNIEMFESKETLKQFLFAPDSIIHEDNDNY